MTFKPIVTEAKKHNKLLKNNTVMLCDYVKKEKRINYHNDRNCRTLALAVVVVTGLVVAITAAFAIYSNLNIHVSFNP